MARKTLGILLALCMVLSLMPFGAFAAKNDADTYELTDRLVEGGEYLIVSASDGEAVALTNNDGSKGTTTVTIADGKIQLDDAAAVWTAAVSSGKLNLGNNGKWLKGASGGLSFNDSMVTDRTWDYEGNQLRSYGRYILYYDAASNAFATSSSSSEKVYLFAKEGTLPEPEPEVTYELVDRLVAGVDYVIVSANDGEGKAVQNNNGSVAAKSVTVANNKLTTSDSSIVWTAETNEAKPEWFNLKNDGKYIERSNGNAAISETLVNADRGWAYNDGSLQHMGSTNGNYSLYYGSSYYGGGSFQFSSSAQNIYLFAKEGAIAPCTHELLIDIDAKAPSCTEDGYEAYFECAECGSLFSDAAHQNEIDAPVPVAALGHDWGEWVVATPAGDTTPGLKTRTCARCGETEEQEIPPSSLPTYVQVDRLVNGVEYLIVNTNEEGTAYVMTNPGVASGSASMGKAEVLIVDGKITAFVPEALWTATTNGEGFTLTNDGNYLEGKSNAVSVYAQQQNADRFWTYSSENVLKFNGSYTLYYSTGSNAFKGSSNSHQNDTVYLFALDGAIQPCQHENLIEHAAKEASCTEAGNDAYWECEVCHKLFSDAAAQTKIDEPVVHAALGHDWGEWETVTVPGATTPGSEKRVCERCGEEDTRATDPTGVIEPGVYMIVMEGNVLTAVPSENTMNTSAGYYYQGLDGVPYEEDMAVEPSMKWTITPDENGGYLITNNGMFLNGTYGKPDLTNTYGVAHVDETSDVWTLENGVLKSANASSTASSAKYLAYEAEGKDQSGATSVMDFFTVRSTGDQLTLILVQADAQCEHDYEAVVTAPTCTEQGYTTYTCKKCGDSYVADYVDALGHAWDDGVVTTPATCTEDGVMTYTCTHDASHTRTEGIPALDHDYKAVVTAPTCTEQGYTTYTCSSCGDSYVDDYVDALGHDYEAAVTAPTCTEQGFTTYTCKNCGDTYVADYVDALGHDYQAVVTAPTCTEAGYTTYTCSRCNDSYVADQVAALGHSWDEGVVTKEATTTEEGEMTYTCKNCGKTRTEVIPMLANQFKDIAADAYCYDAVLWAVSQDQQVTNGYSDGTFRPDSACTRAQVVTFLWRAKGCPEPTTTVNPFSDVDASAYYYKAVLWAAENDITTGYSDGTFRPDYACTRGHVVTFLWRMEGAPAPQSTGNPFNDVPAGKFYTDAALWAAENDITTGFGDGTFRPDSACTRGHVITFLYRDMT